MRIRMAVLLAVAAAVPGPGGARAQTMLDAAGTPPDVVKVFRARPRVGHESLAMRAGGGFGTVSDRFGAADHWIGGMALSGRGEVLWLEGFPSHAAIEGLLQAYQATAGLEAAADSVWRDTGGHLESADVLWAFHRPDLGYKPAWFTPTARAFQVITFRVKPGMEADGEAVFRAFAAAYAAATADLPWATYQVSNGMEGPAYLMIVPMASLAAIDRDLAGMGAVVSKVPDLTALMAQWARAGNSVTSNVYGVVPSLSRVGKEWAAAGGGFWGK